MSFSLLAYTGNAGAAAANFDLTAATDPEISQRNGHYIFTEPFELLAAFFLEANGTRANIFVPRYNAITKFNIWPPNRAATVPSNPQLDWWIRYPPPIPQNEEFQVQTSNNAGVAEQSNVFLWLGPAPGGGTPGWNQNLPQGMGPLPVFECRLSFTTPALVANTWSGLTSITFEQSLRGGTYAVVGMLGQGAAVTAARLVFPRAPMIRNRKLRPGTLLSQALGDVPLIFTPPNPFVFGEWGRFSTFEPPQMEFWASTAGAVAVEIRLYLVWLSESMDVQYAQAG